jgi:hypothetical protein
MGPRRRNTARLTTAIGATLLVLGSIPQPASAGTVRSGRQSWVARYDGHQHGDDTAYAITVDPTGRPVYVTGSSEGKNGTGQFVTIAYDKATGDPIWAARYRSRAGEVGIAESIAVDATGTRVFVGGSAVVPGLTFDYLTVAYDAATGARLWSKRYDGPGHEDDIAKSIDVSPDGSQVFVTGWSVGDTLDYATIAYDAVTGKRHWIARYVAQQKGEGNQAYVVRSSRDGGAVYVTGFSYDISVGSYVYATVAYDAASGDQRWASRTAWEGYPASMAVSPSGDVLYVTGTAPGPQDRTADYATVVYATADGSRLGMARFDGGGFGHGTGVAVAPDGASVYVTGYSGPDGANDDYATVAYDPTLAHRRWVARYDGGHGSDEAAAIAVRPDGTRVYVTGTSASANPYSPDAVTAAFDGRTGAMIWSARYNGPADGYDNGFAVCVSPDGSSVFMTGPSGAPVSSADYATVAYRA